MIIRLIETHKRALRSRQASFAIGALVVSRASNVTRWLVINRDNQHHRAEHPEHYNLPQWRRVAITYHKEGFDNVDDHFPSSKTDGSVSMQIAIPHCSHASPQSGQITRSFGS
jgi:hypothetical protein